MDNTTNKARSLVTLTVLAAVIIIAAAWFLLVSPTLSAASEASSQAEQQESTNANTEVEVNKLRQQFANIEQYKTTLSGLQQQIPTAPGYPDLQRLFAAVALKHQVVITSLTFGSAEELKIASKSDEPQQDDSAVTTDPDDGTADQGASNGSSNSSGGAGASRLFGIPVSIAVTGAYDDVTSTLKELQTMDGRIVLITNVSLTRANARDVDDESGNDTDGVFAGQVFVVTGSTPTESAPPDSGTDSSPSPSPTN